MVQTDEAGQPVVQVREASAVEGAAQIAVEADLRPIGLSAHTPLRASWEPGQGHIAWRMHSAPITTTPCEWNAENAADNRSYLRQVSNSRVIRHFVTRKSTIRPTARSAFSTMEKTAGFAAQNAVNFPGIPRQFKDVGKDSGKKPTQG